MDLLSQHEAFLRAIFDAPDDDTPRLVYADFLQENGEDDRAELIRVQCEIGANKGNVEVFDHLYRLAARERALIAQMTPELQDWSLETRERERARFVRGFLPPGGTLVIAAAALADLVEGRWWIVRKTPEAFGASALSVEPGLRLEPEHIDLLFTLPAVQRVADWQLNGAVREELGHSGPGAFDLVELVQEPAISVAGVEALTRHKGARRITELDLRNNNLDNDAARALVKSPYLDNLERLDLFAGNRFRGRVWQQVIERFGEDVVG